MSGAGRDLFLGEAMRQDVTLLGHRIKFSRSAAAPGRAHLGRWAGGSVLGSRPNACGRCVDSRVQVHRLPPGPCTVWVWWLWTQHVFCSQQCLCELFVLGSDCRVRQGAGGAATGSLLGGMRRLRLSGRWPWGRGWGGVQITRPRLNSLHSPAGPSVEEGTVNTGRAVGACRR